MRTNQVVLITDQPGDLANSSSSSSSTERGVEGDRRRLIVESLGKYFGGAREFARLYVHLSTDKAERR